MNKYTHTVLILFSLFFASLSYAQPEVDFRSVKSLSEIKTQDELTALTQKNDAILLQGQIDLKQSNPGLTDDVVQLVHSTQPIEIDNPQGGDKLKTDYTLLTIDPAKISSDATGPVAVFFRRLVKRYAGIKIYISPMQAKESGAYGYFQPEITDHLALFLDEGSLDSFIAGNPFDETVKHELRHLVFEAHRRLGYVPNIYDYNLTTTDGKKASHLYGYETYLSFEEIYTWSHDMMTNAQELVRVPNGKTTDELIEEMSSNISSIHDITDAQDNGVMAMLDILNQIASGAIPLTNAEITSDPDEGLTVKTGGYTLTNASTSLMNQFKSVLMTDYGKMKVISYFAADLAKMQTAMQTAESLLPNVSTVYNRFSIEQKTAENFALISSDLEKQVQKVENVFNFFSKTSQLYQPALSQ